jgi:hypothetical protein
MCPRRVLVPPHRNLDVENLPLALAIEPVWRVTDVMTIRRSRSRAGRRAAIRAGGIAAGGLAVAGSLAVVTYPRWRTWCLTWGATGEEAARTLPGDDLLAVPDLISTRAIWIDAPPGAIWPWLAQMGPGRGGLYTYDWIENLFGLNMHSVQVVLPQFQDVKVGDAHQLGKSGPILRVAMADPERTLVLRSDDGNWVWAFCLVGNEAGTRFISRNRIATPGASWPSRAFYRYVMEPGSLVMERKMLTGIKERAERLARQSVIGATAVATVPEIPIDSPDAAVPKVGALHDGGE